MTLPAQLAKHLREVYFGGNWTSVNYRDVLTDVTWQQATKKIGDFNTIATLVAHTHYYTAGVNSVLRGGPLEMKDSLSFAHHPIESEDGWQAMLEKMWQDAEAFAQAIEALPAGRLDEIFVEDKYGIYYRNLQGIIEHLHYHLGQIVFLKKMMAAE